MPSREGYLPLENLDSDIVDAVSNDSAVSNSTAVSSDAIPKPTSSDTEKPDPEDSGCAGILVFIGIAYLIWSILCPRAEKVIQVEKEVVQVEKIVQVGKGTELAPPLGLPERVQRTWGQYSPWFPSGNYPSLPKHCEVTQVNILQRHGARYPLEDDGYDESIQRLANVDKFSDGQLAFLKEYEYDLPSEELTPFGAAQSFESGEAAYLRYAHLVDSDNIPFVRAAGEDRVVRSAANWTVGFAAASSQRYNPTVNVVIPQDQNNTLNEACPLGGDGSKEKNEWLDTYAPPIVKRLKKLAPGANITDHDLFKIMAMCPFETIAKQKPSDFCGLFTKKEFLQFEYHGDVEKYYKTGYGEALGPVQGVGYVNELLARLTGRPVSDHTQHNSSFPFPLSRTFYADFTHENLMVAVYSAMGLFNITSHPLHTKKMHTSRSWVASQMVPFSSRMVVERLTCAGGRWGGKEQVEFVRILVNDALQPLKFCGGKQGMCTLSAFVKSQGYARRSGDGDFEKCFP